MPSLPVLNRAIVAEALANSPMNVDQSEVSLRTARRGELVMVSLFGNGNQQVALEGSYFIAATATPGSGITASAATGVAFSDTQGILTIFNNDAPGGKRIILDFINIIITTAPGASTSVAVAHKVDSGNRGSAGTVLGATGTNPKASAMDVGAASVAEVRFGVPTVAASSSAARNVGRNILRTILPVIGDQYIIKFAASDWSGGGGAGTAGAQVLTLPAPPIVIGPQQCYVLQEWSPARNSAYSAECVVGWIER